MTIIREQIFVALETLLSSIAPRVARNPSGDPDAFPAIHIYDGGHRRIEGEAGSTRRQLTAIIEGFVETADGPEAHSQLHVLYGDVIKALLADPTLGGLVELIEDEDLRVDTAELASARRMGFSQDLSIQFTTSRADPSTI